MTQRVEGNFEVTTWSEQQAPGLADAAKVTVATIGQRFTGGVEAETIADMVMTYRSDGTADFLGYQRVLGDVGGHRGSFVLQAVGRFEGGAARTTLTVVPDSGTGDLAGLSGTGTALAPKGTTGTYTLDCDFG